MIRIREVRGNDPDYKTIGRLGKGGFGVVYLVEKRSTGERLACKEIDLIKGVKSTSGSSKSGLFSGKSTATSSRAPSNEDLIQSVQTELRTMNELRNNKYVANFTGDCSVDTSGAIVRIYMDYYPGGDLHDVINVHYSNGSPIFPLTILFWAFNIAKGLHACHQRNFFHLDVKPENILLEFKYDHDDLLRAIDKQENLNTPQFIRQMLAIANEPESFVADCYISDFGIGKFSMDVLMNHETLVIGGPGTPGYIAPECRKFIGSYSHKSDMYSYGVTIYCLCTMSRRPPDVVNADYVPSEYGQELRELIDRCTRCEPSQRPSAAEAVMILEPLLNRSLAEFRRKVPPQLLKAWGG